MIGPLPPMVAPLNCFKSMPLLARYFVNSGSILAVGDVVTLDVCPKEITIID